MFFIWRDAFTRGSRFDLPEFDLYSRRVYSFGGDYDRQPASFWDGTHPRKTRWAFLDWDFTGLKSAVRLDGTLNDPSDIDRGWTVELAFPWQGMGPLAQGRACPPLAGDAWRMFFGRFQKLEAGGQDGFGPKALDKLGAEHLFGFFSQCYERTSLIVTTNLPFAEWPQIFAGDERLAGALIDRLTHGVHVVEIQGDSYRLQTSLKAKKGGGASKTPTT